MIRDPSDGTVRENEIVGYSHNSAESSVNPTLETLKSAITAGKVKPEHLSEQWVYQRAWNDALDFALREIGKVEKAANSEVR